MILIILLVIFSFSFKCHAIGFGFKTIHGNKLIIGEISSSAGKSQINQILAELIGLEKSFSAMNENVGILCSPKKLIKMAVKPDDSKLFLYEIESAAFIRYIRDNLSLPSGSLLSIFEYPLLLTGREILSEYFSIELIEITIISLIEEFTEFSTHFSDIDLHSENSCDSGNEDVKLILDEQRRKKRNCLTKCAVS